MTAMTAILFALLALAAGGGALVYKSWRDAQDNEAGPPEWPPWLSLELADRPLRRVWLGLEDDERAELLQLQPDEARWALDWLAELAAMRAEQLVVEGQVLTESTRRLAYAALPAGGDWGPSYG